MRWLIGIIILLLTGILYMQANPIDTRLIDKIADLEKRLYNMESTRQPYIGDWREYNPAEYSYSSANTIAVSTDPRSNWQAGDKVKLTQTTDKYFTVQRVTSSTIVLNATPDYSLANAGITYIANSRLESPNGFVDNGDWTYLTPSDFTYNKANKINVSNITPSDYFQLGDKLVLRQNSTTKYFYVTRVDSTFIQVNGGDDYTYTNNAITNLAYSRVSNPSGFPGIFTFTPTMTFTAGAGITNDTATMSYSISQGRVFMTGRLSWDQTSGPPLQVEIDTPFTRTDSNDEFFSGVTSISNNREAISCQTYDDSIVMIGNTALTYGFWDYAVFPVMYEEVEL